MKQIGLMFLIQSMLTWHGLGLNQFFLSVLDKIAPVKTMSAKMIKLINLRDNYLRQFSKSKNQSDYELFIYHRNQVKYKKEKDKSPYYINLVNENKNRPKKTMANFERGWFIDQMQNKRK